MKCISVKDRIPDESGWYLTYCWNTSVTHYSSKNKAFNCFDTEDEVGDNYPFCNTTHWMPLPEPPKDGE